MEEISVVDDSSTDVNVYTLAKHDKEDLFNKLITNNGQRPENIVERHAFMQLFSEMQRDPPEKMPDALLIRDIIANPLRYDRLIAFPIITEKRAGAPASASTAAPASAPVSGGAIKMFRPVLHKKVLVSSESQKNAMNAPIEVSFDRPTRCYRVSDGRMNVAMVATGTVVNVIGMRLAPPCAMQAIDHTDRYSTRRYPEFTLDCIFFKQITLPDGATISAPYRDMYNADSLYYNVAKCIYDLGVIAMRLSPLIQSTIDFEARTSSPTPGTYTPKHTRALMSVVATDVVVDAPIASNCVQTTAEVEDNAFFEYVRDNFGALSLMNENTMVSGLQQNNLIYAYTLYLQNGLDDASTRAALASQLRQYNKAVTEVKLAKELFHERTVLSVYMRLMKLYLPAKRYEKLQSARTTKELMNMLTKDEREKLTTEYAVEQKYIRSIIENNCEHVRVQAQLRRAVDIGRRAEILRQLSEFFPNNYPKSKLIECKRCKYDIICPHVVATIETSRLPLAAVREALHGFIANELSANGSQFCRVCGATLFSRMQIEEDLQAVSEFDDALRAATWTEVALIVRQMSFDHAIDTTRLITSVRDSIFPAASIIDVDLSRNQSHTEAEINHRKSLYISILAMTKLIQVVLENKYMHLPRSRDAARGAPSLTTLMAQGADFVHYTHNVAIAAIGGMTRDTIREKIRLAYEHLTRGDVNAEPARIDTVETLRRALLLDPMYQWIARLSGAKKFTDVFSLDDLKRLKPGAYPYSVAKIPRVGDSFHDRVFKACLATAKGKEPPMFYSIPTTPTLQMTPAYAEYEKSQLALIAEEARTTGRERVIGAYSNWTGAKLHASGGVKMVDVKMGEIYDEDGNPHKFNKYVLRRDDAGAAEGAAAKGTAKGTYTLKEIFERKHVSGTGTEKFTVIDRVCETCGVKESLSSKLDEKKINRALDSKTVIDGFFKFYEKRCPKGGVHEYDDNFVCGKCKFNVSAEQSERMNYYREYKDEYEEQKKINAAPSRSEPPATYDYSIEAPQWKENYQYVVDVAKLADVDAREIQLIGAYEGVDHSEIIKGSFTPMNAEKRDDTRVWAVHGVVVNLITSFEKLKNFARSRGRDPMLEAIMSGQSRSATAKLPSIVGNFYTLFEYFYRNEEPERIITMCIQEWCRRLMDIININDDTADLRRKFVLAHVAETLRLQSLTTNREAFNWAIMFGNKTAISDSVTNEEQDGFEAAGKDKNDPFSLDAYDVEDGVTPNIGD